MGKTYIWVRHTCGGNDFPSFLTMAAQDSGAPLNKKNGTKLSTYFFCVDVQHNFKKYLNRYFMCTIYTLGQ